jgi:phospholipid N-methyltransferase
MTAIADEPIQADERPATPHRATYSPEDNKLRIYPAHRLDKATYERVKAAGFRWAPKQELFVVPGWTPEREDLAEELCGEVEDEDTSLVERAEERADRFEDHSTNRRAEADRAKAASDAISDGIPLGQPILVGHHSEKRARKDAERIQNGMRKAVRLWDLSNYWKDRAAGALSHAKYKERPDVRARRIKGLEADERKMLKNKEKEETCFKLWTAKPLTHAQALIIAGRTEAGYLRLPRKEGDREDWTQAPSAYDGLRAVEEPSTLYAPRTVEEVVEVARVAYPRYLAHAERWLAHLANRLSYERAMQAECGGTVADQKKPEVGGAVRCWVGRHWLKIVKVNRVSVSVLDNWGNSTSKNFLRKVEFDKLSGLMTRAEVDEKRAAGLLAEAGHDAEKQPTGFVVLDEPARAPKPAPVVDAVAAEFEALRETGRAEVKIVTAPNLFPTPPELARRVVRLAEIEPGQRVLEPSAGTGNLLRAIMETVSCSKVIVEINPTLAAALQRMTPDPVFCRDFLACNGELGSEFDRIVMNPPFENGADIKHVEHALRFLKDGGRLVAIMANGSRQRVWAERVASSILDLPEGSFKEQGTNVNAAIVVIDK